MNIDDRPVLILHRPHSTVDAIIRQLTQIGLRPDTFWPEPPADLDVSRYGLVMFDADMGYDAQFPWPSGEAPMPAIALIGSEAPGRIAWAIRRGADAHLGFFVVFLRAWRSGAAVYKRSLTLVRRTHVPRRGRSD